MSGATPGQAAREAFGGLGADWYPGTPWNGLHEALRAQWEAGAKAAIDWQRAEDVNPTAEDYDRAAEELVAQERPPADGRTGGQLAYEAYVSSVGLPLSDWPWEADHVNQALWGAVAQAVETEQVRLARADRDAVRGRMLALAARLDESAAATEPSRKSEIEREAAIAIRQELDV